jgi:uncharacterized phiE125 gp8 family phage protein
VRYVDAAYTDTTDGLLAEFKAHLRIGFTELDAPLLLTLQTAREWFERFTRIPTIARTITAYGAGGFCGDIIELERVPVTAVGSVKYLDTNGDLQTVSTDDYRVSLGDHRNPCRIELEPGRSWPITEGTLDDVRVEFTAGWADITTVPALFKQTIFTYGEDIHNKLPAPGMLAARLLAQCHWSPPR